MNIIILSSNTENLKQVTKILADTPYNLEGSAETTQDLTMGKYSLAIIDITDCQKESDYPLDLVDSIFQARLPSLFIASYQQTDLLINLEPGIFDIIFLPQLDPELNFRLKRIISYIENTNPANCLTIGEMVLNLDKYELKVRDRAVELTYKEYELLKLLMKNQDQAFSRDKLLSLVWDYDFYGGSRTVDVHIRRLRSKIPPPYNSILKTVRNVGYMLSCDLTQI